jgi:hypothetical protein
MAPRAPSRAVLPGAFYTLRETTAPPVDLLRKHGVAMAVAFRLQSRHLPPPLCRSWR